MKLHRKSLFVRWCYLMEADWTIPKRTDVCTLCRKAFISTPVCLVFVAALMPIAGLARLIDKGWKLAVKKLRLDRDVTLPSFATGSDVVSQRIADWHDKVCTIVEISE